LIPLFTCGDPNFFCAAAYAAADDACFSAVVDWF
jgi:hypothetical protein